MIPLSDIPGSESWWLSIARQGTPLITPASPGQSMVTFLWREPEVKAFSSTVMNVWLNITGITDHHSRTAPRSLLRVPGTDIWRATLLLSNSWRGSYTLIPDTSEERTVHSLETLDLRQWWQNKLPHAQCDPLNPLKSWRSARGHWVSPLHMPAAPLQVEWQGDNRNTEGHAEASLQLSWCSTLLNNRREVSFFSTGDDHPTLRPLVIMLDGKFWSDVMPIGPSLRKMTHNQELPAAVYLFIDSVNSLQRSQELTCNATFWRAVQQELIPLLQRHIAFSNLAEDTVVVGQSFGGLSALYAVLNWPQRFGCALSQSGSFWWPERNSVSGKWPGKLMPPGVTEIAHGKRPRIAMDAGLHESLILQANRQLAPLLMEAGYCLRYREIEGGHDALCWRGGITQGLRWLWSGLPANE